MRNSKLRLKPKIVTQRQEYAAGIKDNIIMEKDFPSAASSRFQISKYLLGFLDTEKLFDIAARKRFRQHLLLSWLFRNLPQAQETVLLTAKR